MTDQLWRLGAVEVAALLGKGEVSPSEVIASALSRIDETNGSVNAITTVCRERALEAASRLPSVAKAGARGALNGLPVLVKELTDVAGVRTTYGSRLFADHVPAQSDAMVERLEAHGGIVLAKTNVPEFGAGGQTYNDLFGTTRNPWKLGRTSGGSSGGSAAALACGQGWLATGTDMGGSLRNPASFCGVVGLRPTPGRVPRGARGAQVDLLFDTLYVNGPLARNVADLAFFLDAIAGRDLRDPLSVDEPRLPYLETVRRALDAPAVKGMRIGYSSNLGIVPVAAEVEAACRAAARRMAGLGADVDDAGLDFSGVEQTFMPLRSLWFATAHRQTLERFRDRLRSDIVWNIEEGLKITVAEIGEADRQRVRLYARMADFFAQHDLLVLPTVVTTAFPVETKYLEEIEGVKLDNYISWMVLTFALTLTNCCCLSVPAGISSEGLPIGLQIVAPPFCEDRLLAFAAVLERELGLAGQLPLDPRP